jgi:hypothetical protein
MYSPSAAADSSTEFTDRKTGLVVFGIFTVMMGVLCGLLIPLMFFGQAMSKQAGAQQNLQMLAPAIMIYGVLAVVLVWLGIGSILARRWARALLLIFSWSWLLMGVVSIAMMAIMLPQLMETVNSATPPGQPLPASAKSLMLLIPAITLGIIFILLPSAWVFFYQSRHVRATCAARDPMVRWTDRCPLPVIAVCLWLAFSVPMMLLMAVAYKSVIPVFGNFVVGSLGSALYTLFALAWAYAAWSLYRLEARGWWIVFASVSIFAISAFITYSRHDVSELYTLMGYPAQQIAQIQQFSFLKGQAMAWASLFGTLPFLGYLLYVRRFLVRS